MKVLRKFSGVLFIVEQNTEPPFSQLEKRLTIG